ncbi:uncharacterized protein N7525_005322 [Penicillium rubens]|jgi:hypothetical protein|nr:uncharacterized protein N7525_005322 [Penicillium rubens]KAJ5840134.1 hypothetical protein N7525_005322 [Penicillium rubens]
MEAIKDAFANCKAQDRAALITAGAASFPKIRSQHPIPGLRDLRNLTPSPIRPPHRSDHDPPEPETAAQHR